MPKKNGTVHRPRKRADRRELLEKLAAMSPEERDEFLSAMSPEEVRSIIAMFMKPVRKMIDPLGKLPPEVGNPLRKKGRL